MPQATEELRRIWHYTVSDNVPYAGDHLAMTHLERRGYILQKDWTWRHLNIDHVPNSADLSAVMYLIQEWDFGGLIS